MKSYFAVLSQVIGTVLVLQLWQQRLFLFLMRFQPDAGAGQRGGHLDQGLFVNVWLCLTISQMTQNDTKKQMWNDWMLTVTIGSAEGNGKTSVQKVNKMLHVLFRLYQKKLNPSIQQTSRSRWATSPLLPRLITEAFLRSLLPLRLSVRQWQQREPRTHTHARAGTHHSARQTQLMWAWSISWPEACESDFLNQTRLKPLFSDPFECIRISSVLGAHTGFLW